MMSRSKKMLLLALQCNDSAPSENNITLIDQLENDPNFINTLPVVFDDNEENSQELQANGLNEGENIIVEEGLIDNVNVTYTNPLEDNIVLSVHHDEGVMFTEQPSNLLTFDERSSASCDFQEIHSQEINYTLQENPTIENDTEFSDETSEHDQYLMSSPVNNNNADKAKSPLVDYSDHSDSSCELSEEESKGKRKRRKRCCVDKSTWVYEENRRKRERGQEYYGRKKKENGWDNEVKRPAKSILERCKCPEKQRSILRCSVITEEDRQNIFKSFWSMTWGEKKIYVDSLVQIKPTNRHRDRKDPAVSRRDCTVFYNLRKGEELVRVCKTMFLNTLCIGKWCVKQWKEKRINKDKEEKKEEEEANEQVPGKMRKDKPYTEENKALHDFFGSLPTMESHYCRKSSDKTYLLPEWPSKRSLFNFYVNSWCKDHNVKPLSVCKFNNVMDMKNISLFQPKKDQCQICYSHKLGQYPNDKHAVHIEKKDEARQEKQTDKESDDFVYTMDLQAVLLAPRSNVSSLYYKTKLCIHNLCFFDLKSKQGSCFLWNETEGGLNAQEFATIVVKFLSDQVMPQLVGSNRNQKIILYSDGCTYQNRNAVMTNALQNFSIVNNVIIEQKFLEVGHTQMEADALHAAIERQLKNKIINIPAEYIEVCKKARREPEPYSVFYLTHEDFKTFDNVQFYKSIRPGKRTGDPKVTDIRALQYSPNGEVSFKLRFRDDWAVLPQRRDKQILPKTFEELSNYMPVV